MSAAGGAIAGILIANNIMRATKGIETAKTAWKGLESLGLTLSFEQVSALGWASGRERPQLQGTVDGQRVEVRIITDIVHCAHTEVVVVPDAGVDVDVGVYPSPGGVLSRVRDWLRQDIQIDDAAFDAAFLITAKPASAAPQLLANEQLRVGLAELTGGKLVGFHYSKARVVVTLNGVETDPVALQMALQVGAAAARFSL